MQIQFYLWTSYNIMFYIFYMGYFITQPANENLKNKLAFYEVRGKKHVQKREFS